MNITDLKLSEIRPYEKNPRKNDEAVKFVTESIRQFGFKVPIVIDRGGVIVAGHTRYKAAKKLKMETVPCIVADDLTEEQIKAFRLADNKVAEKAEWDFDLLADEMDDLFDFDMTLFGFEEIIGGDRPRRSRGRQLSWRSARRTEKPTWRYLYAGQSSPDVRGQYQYYGCGKTNEWHAS